nr:endonuclease V [Halospeciosus flavus]
MAELQRDLVADAVFADDVDFAPADVALDDPPEDRTPEAGQQTLSAGPAEAYDPEGPPVVVGIDQAFVDDEEAVSAAVAIQDGAVVERAVGRRPLEIPYIPGLLAFREGGAIVDALQNLSVPGDLLVLDGSGRIHFRQAGIATHVGVVFDTPAIGVAKSLLCGEPRESLDQYFEAGERVAIEADDEVEAPTGDVIGYAFQSRQYPNPEKRHVNPLIVSPGHRVDEETAVDFVEALCAGYKLPEPTRLADRDVGRLK